MKTKVAIYVPDKTGRILLGKRVSQQGATVQEWWDIPGGDMKEGETFRDSAVRDIKEDTDIDVRSSVLLFEEMEETKSGIWKAVVVAVDKYEGEPRIVIKEKFCEFRWFAFDRLPEHMYPVTRKVVERIAKMITDKERAELENATKAERAARDKAEKEAAKRKARVEKDIAARKRFINAPIDTPRLILRRWEKKDTKDFSEYVERLAAARYSEHCIHGHPERTINPKLENYIKDETRWAVQLKEGKKIIGGFTFEPRGKNAKEYEIAHTLDEQHTGGGYTSEATMGLVNYGFKTLGLSAIYTSLCSTNVGGLKVISKCGFKFDSVTKNKNACRFDGKIHESRHFSITADEWEEFSAGNNTK